MTDKPRDLGDYQTAVDAYVAAGYSKEGAEAVLDQHCAIVASHKPPAPPPAAVAKPKPVFESGEFDPAIPEPEGKPVFLGHAGLNPLDTTDTTDTTEDAKEEEPV